MCLFYCGDCLGVVPVALWILGVVCCCGRCGVRVPLGKGDWDNGLGIADVVCPICHSLSRILLCRPACVVWIVWVWWGVV